MVVSLALSLIPLSPSLALFSTRLTFCKQYGHADVYLSVSICSPQGRFWLDLLGHVPVSAPVFMSKNGVCWLARLDQVSSPVVNEIVAVSTNSPRITHSWESSDSQWQRSDPLGAEVTFTFVYALWENATKSFGIFSSNLGLIGVSTYNLVEMLVQIVLWYLQQDSFDCKWQNTSVWAGLRKKGNFLPCAVKQSKSGSTEAENTSWPMQYQFNFVLPEIEPCWNGDYIPHSPLETAVAMWQYIGQWDARERELWNIWMNFFIWRLFSLHALFSLPRKWRLTGPKDGHYVHSWPTSLSPWMTFGDWASYLPIWIVPWEINKLLPNLSHCILGSNCYTSFSSIYNVIGSWGTG